MRRLFPSRLRTRVVTAVSALFICGVVVTGCLVKKEESTPVEVLSNYKSPDILIIGDSQISYGAGKFHLNFFQNLEQNCSPNRAQKARLQRVQLNTVAAIGVRSSSLDTWVANDEQSKTAVCKVDEKFGVNAGVYGVSGNPNRKYVQIGQGRDYQFCSNGSSPFQAMFSPGYYQPKLLVMAFLGNSAERWAASPAAATADVKKAMQQIPSQTPCIFMTTAPSYSEQINDLRQKAQSNIKQAFNSVGRRCSFVSGINTTTRAANTNNSRFFRTNDEGRVTDPLHPNSDAANRFFEIMRPQLCNAVFSQIN